MPPLTEALNAVEVLESFITSIDGTRAKLLEDWHEVEQTADLAWTLTEALGKLEKVRDCFAVALDGERADLERLREGETTEADPEEEAAEATAAG